MTGAGRAIVEFGSGSSTKTRLLLSSMQPAAYVPIDISREFLWETAGRLSEEFGELPIHPVEGDFTETLRLPPAVGRMARLGFFPGSTIGNLLVPEAVDLLRTMAATLGRRSMLLIGIDRIKDPSILLPAYDDARGVTAAFNLNLLHRINRELQGTVPVDAFDHAARWNVAEARIESFLVASRDIQFMVDGRVFSMTRGEAIHTENSHKYGPRDACVLLRAGGWAPIRDWTDRDEHFSLILAVEGTGPPDACSYRPMKALWKEKNNDSIRTPGRADGSAYPSFPLSGDSCRELPGRPAWDGATRLNLDDQEGEAQHG